MKITTFFAVSLIALSSAHASSACESAFGGSVKGWRTEHTVHEAQGDVQLVIPSDETRENKLKSHARQIHTAIYSWHDGPWLYFAEGPQVKVKQTQQASYPGRQYSKYDVETGGSDKMLATFSLGPSAHVGRDDKEKERNAELYAATDRIYMWAEVEGKRIDLVHNLKSMGETTYADVAIPLIKDKEVKIFYARYGENMRVAFEGPAQYSRIDGFYGGRVMGFTWTGN